MNQKPHSVACPNCGKNALWTPDNAWRPFCSERCKLIDLGAWAEESYRIPVAEHKDEPDTDSREQNA
ncbi:MAG: DNA gyrase inhibitor YacG [Burkholderiales bacterium]|nr:DNA gyrase inhibitor YacG [Burkholderiales bacterium]